MKATRVEYDGTGPLPPEGSYWKQDGVWYCVTPTGAFGNLKGHSVTEHENGTITVHPSILITATYDGRSREIYHGWLQAGEWRP